MSCVCSVLLFDAAGSLVKANIRIQQEIQSKMFQRAKFYGKDNTLLMRSDNGKEQNFFCYLRTPHLIYNT